MLSHFCDFMGFFLDVLGILQSLSELYRIVEHRRFLRDFLGFFSDFYRFDLIFFGIFLGIIEGSLGLNVQFLEFHRIL